MIEGGPHFDFHDLPGGLTDPFGREDEFGRPWQQENHVDPVDAQWQRSQAPVESGVPGQPPKLENN